MKYSARYICAPGSALDANPSELLASIEAFDPREIAEYLRPLPYKDFLRTPYWSAVVVAKKKQAKWKCERCGENRELQVHHKNYKHRCLEHINLSTLECLCRICHAEEHKKETWLMPPSSKDIKDRHVIFRSNTYVAPKKYISDGKRLRLDRA